MRCFRGAGVLGDRLLDDLLRLGGALEYALANLMAEQLRASDISANRPITQVDIGDIAEQVIAALVPWAVYSAARCRGLDVGWRQQAPSGVVVPGRGVSCVHPRPFCPVRRRGI